MRKLLTLPNTIVALAAFFIFISVYNSLGGMKASNPELLSELTGKNVQPVNLLDSSVSEVLTKCNKTELTTIRYPKYWKGYDNDINEYNVVDLSIGEFHSIEESLMSGSYSINEIDLTVSTVPGELVNRFDLQSNDCILIELDGHRYVTCANWQKISSTNSYVSTVCEIDQCGDIRKVDCLFPDYIPQYLSSYLSNTTICITDPENPVCDTKAFTKYIHNFYKNNLSINSYGED